MEEFITQKEKEVFGEIPHKLWITKENDVTFVYLDVNLGSEKYRILVEHLIKDKDINGIIVDRFPASSGRAACLWGVMQDKPNLKHVIFVQGRSDKPAIGWFQMWPNHVKALAENKSIECISIRAPYSLVGFGAGSCPAFLKMLRTKESLKRLDLSGCDITESTIVAMHDIICAVVENKNLEVLNLQVRNGYAYTKDRQSKFVDLIEKNDSIREINFSDGSTLFSEENFSKIKKILEDGAFRFFRDRLSLFDIDDKQDAVFTEDEMETVYQQAKFDTLAKYPTIDKIKFEDQAKKLFVDILERNTQRCINCNQKVIDKIVLDYQKFTLEPDTVLQQTFKG